MTTKGVVNNFVSSFMTVNVSGSMLYNLRISSGSSYGGYGLMLVNIFAENCLDLSNNGVLEIGEAYGCTYVGSEIFPLNISLARKAGY